jgi:hypothetical protein
MTLFDTSVDYSKDIFRNIRGIIKSQHLFDDLSSDPDDWDAANTIDMHTHPTLRNDQLIQRSFDYSKNNFIDYPFENITASRYSNGSIACWYGGETLETTIHETKFHFLKEIHDSYESFSCEKKITIDRRIALVHCHGLAFDLSKKTKQFPWLTDENDYTRCQEVGLRVANEGHPLLRVPSARHEKGISLVVFNQKILSNVRDFCNLQYVYDLPTKILRVYRGNTELFLSPYKAESI